MTSAYPAPVAVFCLLQSKHATKTCNPHVEVDYIPCLVATCADSAPDGDNIFPPSLAYFPITELWVLFMLSAYFVADSSKNVTFSSHTTPSRLFTASSIIGVTLEI
jgi:hypothetical protein